MGGRRIVHPAGSGMRRQSRKDPLIEIFSIPPQEQSVHGLFEAVSVFSQEKRKQSELLKRAEKAINDIYENFTPAQRVRFFSMLYDRFAESYDAHMGIETRHYDAIRRVLQYAMPYLRTPMIDLTAGTGEPLMYAMDFMQSAGPLRGGPLGILAPAGGLAEVRLQHAAYANEISERMLGKARMKLAGRGVGFLSHDAYRLPARLRAGFNTALCAQTFHLISDDDKTRLVRSMKMVLAPGGAAIVMEEDPFRITRTEHIEPLSLFLRAIVRPVRADILVGRFEVEGFTKINESATAGIDSEHAMRLHIFRKG